VQNLGINRINLISLFDELTWKLKEITSYAKNAPCEDFDKNFKLAL